MSNQRFKFRVWVDSADNGKMFYPEFVKFNKDGSVETEDYYGDVVQQYTGVLDKHGKEIYEGDIIKTFGPYLDIHAVEYDKGVVTWLRESFCLCQKYIGGNEMSHYVHCDCCPCNSLEVIGNIFETPLEAPTK